MAQRLPFKRSYPIFDSVQTNTSMAAGSELNFFTVPKGVQANQVTSGTNTPYQKTKLHTNIKTNTTEFNQTLTVKGFGFWADEADLQIVQDLFINSKALFEFFVGDDLVFTLPLGKMVGLKNTVATMATDAQSAAKAQKLGLIFPDQSYYSLLPGYTIDIPPQNSFRAIITTSVALTYKKFTFDYNTLAANAAYTSAFNIYVGLDTEESRV